MRADVLYVANCLQGGSGKKRKGESSNARGKQGNTKVQKAILEDGKKSSTAKPKSGGTSGQQHSSRGGAPAKAENSSGGKKQRSSLAAEGVEESAQAADKRCVCERACVSLYGRACAC